MSKLAQYFLVARGTSDECRCCTPAAKMTKWSDTNYYIVCEINTQTCFSLNLEKLIEQIRQAPSKRLEPKPVIVGSLSYLSLAPTTDHSDKLEHLKTFIELYLQLFNQCAANGVERGQVDEPTLATD